MWIFYSALQAALDLKRTCRQCKHEQLVKLKYRQKTVPCERCGTKIAPPKEYR